MDLNNIPTAKTVRELYEILGKLIVEHDLGDEKWCGREDGYIVIGQGDTVVYIDSSVSKLS